MPKNPHADFSPVLDGYSGIGAFRFWCQTALPLTYDDSLSYYELLNKVVNYLNHTIEDLTAVESNTSALAEAYNQLQKYVNDYFDNLDVEAELRNVLDAMAEDGTLDALLDPLVENHLPGIVDEKIDGVVAEQIDGAVAGQIDESVADQLPALVDAGIPGEVSEWLTENVDPVGSAVVVDSSLTISGAAADAKVTGDELSDLKTQLNDKVDKFTAEGTSVNLPVQTTDKKYIELTQTGKLYNSNGNLFDICNLENGIYNSGYGITLTVTNKSHIAISGTATQAHYIKITDGVQGGLTRSGCGADLKSFDYPIGDNFYLCFRKNIANNILVYVVASDGTVATGGNSLQNDRAFKLENYDNWAGVALYVSNGYEVPNGVEIDVSLQIGDLTNPYMAPNTDIISAFSSGIVDGNGLIASNKSGTATSVIEFDPEQVLDDIDNLYNKINYFGKVRGTGSNIYIESDKTSYNVTHIVNATINADLWRVYSGSVKVGENWEYLWNGQDADGVVSIKGESDFIGGFHGDEILTDFAIYIDGVEQTNLTFMEKPYNEIVIYQESDVYHCNASETPTVVAFKRNKVIVFNAQGYTVKNYWVAQENLELTTAYFGMLSVQKYQSDGTSIMDNGYYTDVDYKYHDNSTGFNNNPNLTMVTFNTAGGDITIEAKGMTPGNYKANVSTYSSSPERLKVYMGPIIATTATAVTVNQGDVLKGEARIYVK